MPNNYCVPRKGTSHAAGRKGEKLNYTTDEEPPKTKAGPRDMLAGTGLKPPQAAWGKVPAMNVLVKRLHSMESGMVSGRMKVKRRLDVVSEFDEVKSGD